MAAKTAIVKAWQDCTFSSFASQSKTTPDPNLAAEQAFVACNTEEMRVRAAFGAGIGFPILDQNAQSLIIRRKAELKRSFTSPRP